MFTTPLGLLALLAVPAVVALHLLRRRFAPRTVSALFLWTALDRDPAEGRRWDRLRSTASLLLESLAALLLALALAGPRGCAGEGRHLVVVLDDSASMAARVDGEAAWERAAEEVSERIEDLGARDRVTLIATGPRPRVLAGPQALPGEARSALAAWRPSGPDADADAALALGRGLGGAVLWVTDAAPPPEASLQEGVEWLAVGAPADNVGFVDAARGAEEIALSLASFSERAEGRIRIEGEGRALVEQPFVLEAGGRASYRIASVEGAAPLTARLVRADGSAWEDGLDLDDRVWLAPPARRVVRLGSALPPALNRALGLASGRADALGVGRWVAAVPDSAAAPAAEADLVLTLEEAPATRGWAVCLTGPAAPGPSGQPALLGPFLSTGDALLRGFGGEGLIWTPGSRPALGPEDRPLLLAGERPLLIEHAEGGPLRYTLDLDPWRSTVARSVDWPVLLANLAELRRADLPGPRAVQLRAGEGFQLTDAGSGALIVEGRQTGTSRVEARGDLFVEDLAAPDLYAVRDAEGAERAVFAVNLLSAAESDLRERGSGSRDTEARVAEASLASGGASALLALIAAGVLLLDWVLLARGRP